MTLHPSDKPSRICTVIVVDDHPTIREGLIYRIARQPDMAVCGEADDIEPAIRLVEGVDPDVAVIDMGLKTGSGIELIKRLRARGPRPVMLAWSMHDAALFGDRAIKAGAAAYVTKHQPTDDVIDAIRRLWSLPDVPPGETSSVLGGPRRRERKTSIESLSDRELQVFQMIGQGLSMADITARMNLSSKTVETYRARIKQKLELSSHAELMRRAVQWTIESR